MATITILAIIYIGLVVLTNRQNKKIDEELEELRKQRIILSSNTGLHQKYLKEQEEKNNQLIKRKIAKRRKKKR